MTDELIYTSVYTSERRNPSMAQVTLPAHLFKSLQLSRPELYNVYLVGSRLWGTNTATSDWDLLIVGDLPSSHLTSVHKSQYDIKLLDREEFAARVKQGSIMEVVCALLRKGDTLQYAFGTGDLPMDPDTIKTWLEERQAKDLEKAEKFWLKGNRQAGWKILRHILHANVLYNHLVVFLREKRVTLTIDEVQTIVRPATFLCDKGWLQMEWSNVYTAVLDALKQLHVNDESSLIDY